jgi:hypothetical protein
MAVKKAACTYIPAWYSIPQYPFTLCPCVILVDVEETLVMNTLVEERNHEWLQRVSLQSKLPTFCGCS